MEIYIDDDMKHVVIVKTENGTRVRYEYELVMRVAET
mgnify:CR=1 FL=1